MKNFFIIIANPPWEVNGYGSRSNTRWPFIRKNKVIPFPIYLAYSASVLRKNNFKVKVIDAVSEELSIDRFVNEVKRLAPQVLVMETSTASIEQDITTAKKIKNNIGLKTVLIGPHVTYFHKDIIRDEAIDVIVRGEFEYTILELAERWSQGGNIIKVNGTTHKGENGEIVVEENRPLIEDLDELPFPARDLFNLDYYDKFPARDKGNITMIAGRGCPYQCIFCLWPQTMYGHRCRFRSPENIIAEIEEVKIQHGTTNIFFDDDVFAINRKRVFEFCDKLKNSDIDIKWQCYGRADMASVDMLREMKEAGCTMVRFGIESGSQEILNRARKGVKVSEIELAFGNARKAGLKTFGTIMFGLPGETRETMRETIRFAKKLDPDFIQFCIATPYPGTEFFSYLEKNGFLLTKEWPQYNGSSNAVFEYPELSRDELKEFLSMAWRAFYFRPSKIIQQLRRIKSMDDLKRILRGLRTVLRGHF